MNVFTLDYYIKKDQLIAAGSHLCPVDQGEVQESQFHLIPQVEKSI